MTTLGLGAKSTPSGEVKVGFRSGWLRYAGMTLGGAGGAAIVLGGYQVLRTEPGPAFGLLQVWGPAFLIAMLAIAVGGRFLEGLILAIRESFTVVATSVHDSAQAAGRQADALTRLADQGSRQAEEVKRLAIYAAQEFPGVYERFDRQDDVLDRLAASVSALGTQLGVRGGGDGS